MESNIDHYIDQIDNGICAVCFDALEERLKGTQPQNRPLFQKLVEDKVKTALFVTLMILEGEEEHLRGCIGTLSPVNISELCRYACSSAFHDDRFHPLHADELKNLVCYVSLLHSYEDSNDVYDWEIGKHGIYLRFQVNGVDYSATYLPEVALEHNMSKESAIQNLIRKSGYRGRIDRALYEKISVQRYQSKKYKLTYAEYKTL